MAVGWVSLFVLLFIGRVRSVSSSNDTRNSVESHSSATSDASDIVRKVISKGCAKKYTMTCFKMDMVDLVDLLSETTRYQLFPGVAVVRDNVSDEGSTRKKLPDTLIRSLASDFPYGESNQLDEYLIGRISEYLSTHSVSLRLLDPLAAERAQSLREDIFGTEGRGKGSKGHGTLMAGILMMKGTLLTIGFGALAALAGKALMTGLLSLVLSAIMGLKSHHGGHAHKQTTYEIISKPMYSHSHSHSAEIQHEHEHSHAHTGSYSYGRNLDYNEGTRTAEVEYIQLPAAKEDDLDAKRTQTYEYGSPVEYKTITDDDLKNYYNNLEYATIRNHEIKYRKQKSFPQTDRENANPTKSYFIPLTTTAPATAAK